MVNTRWNRTGLSKEPYCPQTLEKLVIVGVDVVDVVDV
jgi:hypothetical protein